MPYADTPAMQTFLEQFSQTIAQDEHAVMILDRAGWHGSAALVIPANITLLPLPAYSPELNRSSASGSISRSASSLTACSPITTQSSLRPAMPGTGWSPRPEE
jgi:hypothetical protein